MAIELKVPEVGESITEVVIGEWLKAEGDSVEQDENLVIIETDKVNVELPAPQSGVIAKIVKGDGEEAKVGDVIGLMEVGDAAPEKKAAPEPAAEAEPAAAEEGASEDGADETGAEDGDVAVSPAARRLLAEAGLEPSAVAGSGKGGRILKEDVLRHLGRLDEKAADQPAKEAPAAAAEKEPPAEPEPAKEAPPKAPAEKPRRPAPATTAGAPGREEEVVPLSPLRRRVAERLVQAQREAAILTTFNEIDMSAVIALRKRHQDGFREAYGIKLGFMSFFVKATIEALKAVPGVNGQFRDGSVVYHNYYDIGVAVGGGKGLVVPVIRNAERLSFAEVEQAIADLAARARDNKLTLEELQGGTFTISNGGIYGSLLSTPILNPPQTGILGLHKIEERPVAVDGEVVVRPMMYVALSYDHRLIDGREAVTFLVKIKERIEDPTRILLEV